MTAFTLVRLFGENQTLWLAIIVNGLIGALALWLSGVKTLSPAKETVAKEKAVSGKKTQKVPPVDSSPNWSYSTTVSRLVVWLFAGAGFASLAYEVVWTRTLLFFVSSTTYSFAIILSTFLFGIALGSHAMAGRVDSLKRPLLAFASVETVIAILALISIPVLQNMNRIQIWLLKFVQVGHWTHIVIFLTLSSLIILIGPALCMGAAFPIINRIYVTALPPLGQRVGRVYMSNTTGGIVGSLCAGFVLLPFLGINGSILLLACCNLFIATAALAYESNAPGSKKGRIVLGIMATLALLVAGLFVSHRSILFQGTLSFQKSRVLYYSDASAATLSVLERIDEINPWGRNVRLLNINGNNTAHTTFSDIIIHKMLAHLPMLIHPDPQNALVIGFGFGNTCHSFLQYPMLQFLDCVELVKEERISAPYFSEENQGVFQDRRFHFIVNDGRNYVLATSQTYDIISTNAVDPKFSPMLYTEEFYRLAKKKLNENGLLVAWLPLYGMTQTEVFALIKSMVTVFPNTTLWYNNPEHMLLLAGNKPLTIDYRRIIETLQIPTVAASLQQIFLDNPDALLSTFFMGEKTLGELSRQSVPHTDQHPLVEFSRVTLPVLDPALVTSLLNRKETISPYCQGLTKDERQRLSRYESAMGEMLNGLYLYRFSTDRTFNDTTKVKQAMKLMRQAIDQVPENDFNLINFLDWVQHQDDIQGIVPYLERAVKRAPQFAKAFVLHGLAASERGDWQSALQDYDTAVAINDRSVSAQFNAGVASVQLQRWPEAAKALNMVLQIQPDNVFAHSILAQVYYMMKDYPQAIRHIDRSIELVPGQANSYFNQGAILERMGEIKKSVQSFEKGLQLAPNDARAREKLQQLKSRLN
ncbi:MAG TPA: fused MFS/spermidine synthase [bacterium]